MGLLSSSMATFWRASGNAALQKADLCWLPSTGSEGFLGCKLFQSSLTHSSPPLLHLLFLLSSLFLFLLFPSSLWDIYKYTLTPQFLTQALSLLTFAVCEDKRFSSPLQSPRGGHGPVFVESSTLMKCR